MEPLKIINWNAEGVNSKKEAYSKKMELENILSEEKIHIAVYKKPTLHKITLSR